MEHHWKSRTGLLIVLCGVLLGATTLAYPRTSLDTPTFTYVAETILRGEAPYRDAWDVKFPGIHLAYALCILLLGKSAVALRVFVMLWQTVTALVLARISLRVYGKETAALITGALYLLVCNGQNFWNQAQPDGMLSLPLAVGFLFLVRALEDDRGAWWALAGAGVGVAVLFKYPVGLVGVAMLYAAGRPGGASAGKRFGRIAALGAGFLLPLAMCGFYLYAKGALQDFWTAEGIVAMRYVLHVREQMGWRCMLANATLPVLIPIYAIAGVGLGAAWERVSGKKPGLPVMLLLAWLGTGILTLALHGHFLAYHYAPIMAPAAVLCGSVVVALLEQIRARRSVTPMIVLGGVILALVAPVTKIGQHLVYEYRALRSAEPRDGWSELGSTIRQRTAPTERIFVWGNVPAIYVQSERQAASRFIYVLHLAGDWHGVDLRSVFLKEFTAHKPEYFVLIKGKPEAGCLATSASETAAYASFAALRAIVETEYEVEQDSDARYTLYRRRKSAAPAAREALPFRPTAAREKAERMTEEKDCASCAAGGNEPGEPQA